MRIFAIADLNPSTTSTNFRVHMAFTLEVTAHLLYEHYVHGLATSTFDLSIDQYSLSACRCAGLPHLLFTIIHTMPTMIIAMTEAAIVTNNSMMSCWPATVAAAAESTFPERLDRRLVDVNDDDMDDDDLSSLTISVDCRPPTKPKCCY